ncbi:GDP-fucose protein O-fucosyltransferase [Musa troglodytarum]|uniref:O-fucosyltransferase family protein n=1 Tax=Musa troglodytarum TaxID=320322 RepID=A0A9E7L721_9LILI|nr:GDP-fucose protein O-fucosyltransferase [Musa troglodytarum]
MEGCVDRLSTNEVTCVASTPAWGPNTAFTGAVTAALSLRLTTLSSLSLLPRKEYNNRGSHEAPPPHKSIPPESNHRSREGERIGAERPSSVDAMQHHAYNRLGSGGGGGGGGTPSPPASPRRSPRIHRRAGKGGGGGRAAQGAPRTIAQRMAWMLLSFLLRRQAIFLFAPLLYVAAMLFYMGTVPIDSVPRIISRSAPGSVYRSPKLYERLRPAMDADNSSDGLATVWKHSFKGGGWRPCIHTSNDALPDSNGYIYVEANGGLNQQRTSICNAVAVAGYLNATLVIPYFHYHSIWRDPSKFNDIYNEDHFINTLKSEVQVVHQVPEYIMERFGHNLSNVFNFKIKAWSSIQYYKDAVLPKLVEEKLIRISPFANRLSFDAPSTIQRLRCLANFEALRFSNPIATLAAKLVSRMKEHSKDNDGKYIAVHLRFEEDMVAFSCCVFDGGEEEKQEMNAARERGWRGKFTKRGRVIRPGTIRINGKCPLTPLEVGLMLRGMGFGNNTAIYLASGKIYKAEKTMVPLLEMFPLLQTKETLASTEELDPFKNYSSRMAAIDYSVCLHSEVFVTTQGGNFPHFLIGHRRYLYGGHSKTIKPDKRKLALLFDNPNIGWKSLKRQLLNMRAHSDAKGMEMKRPSDSLYTYPCPDCMCRLNKTEVSKSSSAR